MYDTSKFMAIDFETTDKDASVAKPVEVAVINNLPWEKADSFCWSTLINPLVPIPPETSAVHHITDTDVAGAPTWDMIKDSLLTLIERNDPCVLIAHNAEYEQGIMKEMAPLASWICTYKCALRVWPDAPSHKNEGLRYWLGLEKLGRRHTQAAHSALHDCQVTMQIFNKLLRHASVEQMLEWSALPAKLPTIPFGKHYKQRWEAVPAEYLTWIIRQPDMRKDVIFCAQEELTRRARGATRSTS